MPTSSRAEPRARLFCLPHAGAGASAYRPWTALIPNWLALTPLQLAGREERLSETPLTNIQEIARSLLSTVISLANRPFFLFGHSMGALIAFELAHELRRLGLPEPQGLLLSGRQPPHRPTQREPLHHLPDDLFVERLRDMGGTPPEVFEHSELLELLLPTLRADFEACDTYRSGERTPLDLPIHVFGGRDDRNVPADDLMEWNRHTTESVSVTLFPGGHFYLMERRAELSAAIVHAVMPQLVASS
jgi:medium-chain acyl-[acyl-carrier-protein] hydrolase